MKIEVLGDKKKPAVLLVHGMFCNADSVKHFAKYLQDEYYVIVPTMSGHYPGSADYISKEKEAEAMLKYLHDNEIEELALLQGTSMGAEVALEFARISDIPIRHYFFDGGPFFDFPKWFKVIMCRKFQGFVKVCKGKTPDEACETLMKNRFIKWLIGKNASGYKAMMTDFATVAGNVTSATVANVVETCYACKLPEFSTEIHKQFIFFYAEKEPARKSEKRLQKVYPFATYNTVSGVGHGGLQAGRPKEYAEQLLSIIR